MQLSRKILSSLNDNINSVPSEGVFDLPEKVLQFGTGVLLRGLPDYYIDKANKQGVFNGRVVMVKSTDSGDTTAYETQDALYTQCIMGIAEQQMTREYIVNAAVSRLLSAKSQWSQVLECAADPLIEIIISNTTEVGIVLMKEDNVHAQPPISFPAKLLAFLYERYHCFHGDIHKGMLIIPTELIPGNGELLRSIVLQLAELNNMDHRFIDWLEAANCFCNSLVDRIVPGKLPAPQQQEAEALLGYTDQLMIASEPYSLWAIETSSRKARSMLSFAAADNTVIITNDINKYRELKLRLLNGTHTFTSGLAFIAGAALVKDAMQNQLLRQYVESLMKDEIAPCICDESISATEALAFCNQLMDRFSNPFIEHKWLSITLNYTEKMKRRNVPMLLKYYELKASVPHYMALGFAAYLLFMQCKSAANGNYEGERNGFTYIIQDEQAHYFCTHWAAQPFEKIAATILSDRDMWNADLNALPGFVEAVQAYMDAINQNGVLATLQSLVKA